MALFALCLHPFLHFLGQNLPGIRIGRRSIPTVTVAYADDVTIFITSVADFATIAEAINMYERASGAKHNSRKSRALAVGGWCTEEWPFGVAYHPSKSIQGVTFWSTIEQTVNDSLARLTAKVRAHARDAHARGQFLANRICYVKTFLLSKIWYTAQIMSAPTTYTQQLTTAIACYIWRGSVFRVPISTLQKSKQMGGWGLTDIAAKCKGTPPQPYVYSKQKGQNGNSYTYVVKDMEPHRSPGESTECAEIPHETSISAHTQH
jgi:hypothetical protein